MKIAVNTRLLLKNKLEGIGWFTKEVMERSVLAHPEHDFIFFFDRKYDPSFVFAENVTPVVLSPQARHPILFFIWFEWSVRRALKKHKPDVFLSPDGYLSLWTSSKQIAVIHDINFEFYPQFLPLGARLYLKYFFPLFAKKANRIITVSEFSKSEIISQYQVESESIDVAYNGANEMYVPITNMEAEKVCWHYTRGIPYFIYVGALQPRKNIEFLLKGYDAFRAKSDEAHRLLIVGEKKWWNKKHEEVYQEMHFKNEVIFTGRLDPDELAAVVAAARALVYVSFYEGFGIPVLEGMQAGTPVICSNQSAMPEVAGKAALTVNPFDTQCIGDAMLKVSRDANLRDALSKNGIERAQHFSWDKTAATVWNTILKTVKE